MFSTIKPSSIQTKNFTVTVFKSILQEQIRLAFHFSPIGKGELNPFATIAYKEKPSDLVRDDFRDTSVEVVFVETVNLGKSIESVAQSIELLQAVEHVMRQAEISENAQLLMLAFESEA